jgi:hypothetical protein
MIGTLDRIALGVILYGGLCAITVLSGNGILKLLRLEGTKGSFLLAPFVAQSFWTLSLGVLVGVRIPIKNLALGLWVITFLFAGIGIPWRRWRSVQTWKLLLFCMFLPSVTMLRYFLFGLTDYLGSVLPDGWSYIAFGQYLWEYSRGIDSGLAPLYQYAAHLSETRFIAPSLLAFFSPLVSAGDTQMVSGLLQAWGLFNLASVVAFFGVVNRFKASTVIAFTALASTAGWMANLIWANNFDNELALAFIPALAGIIFILDVRWSWWILISGLLAALLYTYPELAIVIMGLDGVIALPRLWQVRRLLKPWLKRALVALALVALFLLPIQSTLLTFVRMQIDISVPTGNIERPGEHLFEGLKMRQFQPGALWSLGNEQQFKRFKDIANVIGYGVTVLGAFGVIAAMRQRQWGISIAIGALALGVSYCIVGQQYSYGAYKLIVLGWWCFSIVLVLGVEFVMASLVRSPNRQWVTIAIWFLVGLFAGAGQITMHFVQDPSQSLNAGWYRQVNLVKSIAGTPPIRVAVDNWIANEWAVYYLRDSQVDLSSYRMYMAQPHLLPYLKKAKAIDSSQVAYVLTDDKFASESPTWIKQWESGPYILWRIQ